MLTMTMLTCHGSAGSMFTVLYKCVGMLTFANCKPQWWNNSKCDLMTALDEKFRKWPKWLQFILLGTWMSAPDFVAYHTTAGETFQWKTQMLTSGKSQVIAKDTKKCLDSFLFAVHPIDISVGSEVAAEKILIKHVLHLSPDIHIPRHK